MVAIFPKLIGELTYPPIHPSSRGADSWESGPWDYSSLLFSSPSLYFSPFSRYTHRMDYEVSSLAVQQQPLATTSLPEAKLSKQFPTEGAWCLDTSLRVVSLQQRKRQCERAYRRRPTELKTKTTETEAHSPLATVYACTDSRQSIPGKIWVPTNQIRAISASAHASRELLARAVQASRGI